jgi:hypothetical protein
MFSKDFAHMKNKILQMQSNFNLNAEKTQELE